MGKKKALRLLEACAFVIVLLAVVFSVSNLTERKKSRETFGLFLEEPQAYDVLFFGDSRLMNCMLPMEMWADYGVAGFNLACYGNSMPVAYWSLMNALDYAQPKLAVFAVNGVGDLEKVTGSTGDLHTALDYLPLTRTKARAIEDLMYDPEFPDAVDDEGNRYRDIKWEFYFPLGKYHSRWSELTQDDFAPKHDVKMGGEALVGITVYEEYELFEEDIYAEEIGHGFDYLRKSIEACQERGIEVLLLHLPQPVIRREQMQANTVSSIAQEYGVDFLDLAMMDSIVDYMVDCYDQQPHMNMSGTQKVTDYLGSYISANYDLPDRRNDPAYAHWHPRRDAFIDEKLKLLRAQTDLHHVLVMLNDDDFDVSIAVGADAPLCYDDLGILLMHNIARERVRAGDEYAMWSNAMYPLEVFDEALVQAQPYCMTRKGGLVHEYIGQDAEREAKAAFGGMDRHGVHINVIDRRTGKTAVEMQF